MIKHICLLSNDPEIGASTLVARPQFRGLELKGGSFMNHERLVCYQVLKGVANILIQESSHWPRGNGELQDQMKRALISALLNLVEGNTRRSNKERHRFFEVTRGSISEVAACLDLAQILRLIESSKISDLKSKLRECYAMIRRLP